MQGTCTAQGWLVYSPGKARAARRQGLPAVLAKVRRPKRTVAVVRRLCPLYGVQLPRGISRGALHELLCCCKIWYELYVRAAVER